MDDYNLYKAWWYSVLYGAGVETRMKVIDSLRSKQYGTISA